MSHREVHDTLADNGPRSSLSQINLGIDFGTRFTKVCYRDVGAEHSWFLQVEKNGQPRSILPSEVNISNNGALHVDFAGDRPSSDRVERYLKMRLVRTDGDSHATNHTFHEVQALSAFYIAKIIHYADVCPPYAAPSASGVVGKCRSSRLTLPLPARRRISTSLRGGLALGSRRYYPE